MKRSLPTRTLPAKPDLDQLRRQAKELLEAFRSGDPDITAEVNQHYRDADPSRFVLHDAQLTLGRSYGFDSWPKLKAFVDGVTVQRLAEAVRRGDEEQVRAMLSARPELVHVDMAGNNEHRALHYAVLDRLPEMVSVLMQHGADARKGIYPHRDATGALTLAKERGYDEIVAIIQEEEQRRREAMSGDNAPPTAVSDELTETILKRDESRALAMLENDPALTKACNRNGWTALHVAAAMRNERIVAWLLDHDADPNQRGPGDRMPLDHAVGKGWRQPGSTEQFVTVAELLRSSGAELTARSAVALGEADWLRARHAEGALNNSIEDDGGLLTVAVRHDRPETLRLLLDLGFDPDERMRVGDLEEVEFSWGMPLWHCALLGKREMAEMLLKSGADPNGRVYASGSPVSTAYGRRDWTMVEVLKRHGGVVDAITAGYYREEKLAKQMLTGEVDVRLEDGMFAGEAVAEQLLGAAACGGSPEIVSLCLEQVDWPRDDSRWYRILEQPLRLWNHMSGFWANSALDRGTYVTCFGLVLERCDANVRGRFGRVILHDVAAFRTHMTDAEQTAFATLLLDAGARLDVRDDLLRSTPLGWACRWGQAELVKLLLSRGAAAEEPAAEPWATPRAWARKMGNDAVLALVQ